MCKKFLRLLCVLLFPLLGAAQTQAPTPIVFFEFSGDAADAAIIEASDAIEVEGLFGISLKQGGRAYLAGVDDMRVKTLPNRGMPPITVPSGKRKLAVHYFDGTTFTCQSILEVDLSKGGKYKLVVTGTEKREKIEMSIAETDKKTLLTPMTSSRELPGTYARLDAFVEYKDKCK